MAQNFLDWTVFTDPWAGLDLLRHTVKETNIFDSSDQKEIKGYFKAIILNDPQSLSAAGSAGQPDAVTTDKDSSRVAKYCFYGRIDPRINPISPHVFLPDPCELSTAPNGGGAAIDAVVMHTIFIMTVPNKAIKEMPKLGDIVEVGLYAGPQGGFNVQYGKYIKPVPHGQKTATQSTLKDACSALAEAFDSMPLSSITPGRSQQADYVNAEGVTAVIDNGQMPTELLTQVDSRYAHPATYLLPEVADDFNRMAKAFFEHFGTKFPITETYRTYATQVSLKGRKPRLAATPGTSNHGWGVAIDWGAHGFTTDAYKWQLENGHKYNWINPCWAREGPDAASCKDASCVGQKCGSKPEAWHIEHTQRSRYVKNIRSKMDVPPVEAVAQGSDSYDEEGGGSG